MKREPTLVVGRGRALSDSAGNEMYNFAIELMHYRNRPTGLFCFVVFVVVVVVVAVCVFRSVFLCGDATTRVWHGYRIQLLLKGIMYFFLTKKHNVHRFTLNLHSLKIMIVESFP